MSKIIKTYNPIRVNETIKLGDKVMLIDGSSLSRCYYTPDNINAEKSVHQRYSDNSEDSEPCIVHSDFDHNDEHDILENLVGTVVEANVLCYTISYVIYLQDLIIKIGTGFYRTNSTHVRKIK